ncbi:sugar transferase [Mesonia aestuariivivens]|uniref:Sugar transferase n=1 Tax=Mesonia aestuariivivens TaxID=2796128 RepID=A0ABS6W321_9FLAO|nr:sugar transferase [Mesonia aestuariivivens]MBW2962256.1 sugar transferase [Mesonia aestuariivivens]
MILGKSGKSFIIYKFKLDVLPQLFNILQGNMSIVGPKPDIPGYYDCLQSEAANLLKLKPGLTGYASLHYFNEEKILNNVNDPKHYNDQVIFPQKIRLNLWYLNHISLCLDLKIILKTLILLF